MCIAASPYVAIFIASPFQIAININALFPVFAVDLVMSQSPLWTSRELEKYGHLELEKHCQLHVDLDLRPT